MTKHTFLFYSKSSEKSIYFFLKLFYTIYMKNFMIAPSLLAGNFANLGQTLQSLEPYFEIMHLDVMDGHFVKPITFGSQMVSSLRANSHAFFDVHLMTHHVENHISSFADAGANGITFHVEAETHANRMIELIKSKGIKAGISIVPSTPISAIKPLLGLVDLVLVMSVNPGYGGQSFIDYSFTKVEQLAKLRDQGMYSFNIQVDGGVNFDNAEKLFKLGANNLVVGSCLINSKLEANISQFKKICDNF